MKFESILIITHSGLNVHIDQNEIEEALGKDMPTKRTHIDINLGDNKLEDLYWTNFEQLALEQTRIFLTSIEPWINENPHGVIAYFGLAPVPLCIHLGNLIGNFRKYWIFQHHHSKKIWYRNLDGVGSQLEIAELDLPEKTERGKGDVLLRISTSYLIDENQSRSVLHDPMKEIDLKLEKLDVDAFINESHFDLFAEKINETFGAISSFLPNSDSIHLIASVPCGVAFLIGTKINPNVTPRIITYQYNKDETPRYKEALVISSETTDLTSLTMEDIKKANKLRKDWAKMLTDRVIPYIKNEQSKVWYDQLKDSSRQPVVIPESSKFLTLPSLSELSLQADTISVKDKTVGNGFKYDKSTSQWSFDDRLLSTLQKRAEKKLFDIQRAGRLFLYHEALHYSALAHNLNQENAEEIGRFPKVIEEADYQADVYAILSDWKYSTLYEPRDVASLKKYFLDTIETAVETMWAFIDNGNEVHQFQIRGMNRLLIWYWQYVMIENSGNSLQEVVNILINRPIIEITGFEVKVIGHRTFFILNDKTATNWQMAAFYNNKVYRFTPNHMTSVVNGFRQLDGEQILKGMRSFIANL